MIYYRRFPGDYLRDTLHLSAAEDGMYCRLLDVMYSSEKPLPLDRQLLYATVRANSENDRQAVESVLGQFFREKKRGFFHKKVDKEIAHFNAKSEQYRVSGRKGGIKRQAIAKQSLEIGLSESQASQIPDPESRGEADRFSPNSTLMQELGLSLSLVRQYKKMRETIHRPLVPGGEDLIFTELLELQVQGESPSEVMEQAIKTSSYTFRPVRKEKQNEIKCL